MPIIARAPGEVALSWVESEPSAVEFLGSCARKKVVILVTRFYSGGHEQGASKSVVRSGGGRIFDLAPCSFFRSSQSVPKINHRSRRSKVSA